MTEKVLKRERENEVQEKGQEKLEMKGGSSERGWMEGLLRRVRWVQDRKGGI